MNVIELDHIVLNVADAERSLSWYIGVIGLAPERVEMWREKKAPFPSVRINDATIIDIVETTRAVNDRNVDHFCLVVDRADVDAILVDDRLTVVEGPGTRSGARGDGWSVYVKDPDGNKVEFRSYG
ncbi:MAG: glyoxalase/bleomycin resistance protein/dioxygenase [Acidimicrobiales bacterium]|nr:glyoxalase/bleomycin resistance protein/dioxygenase [Acidimicrobiales bacterium]